MKRHRVRSWFHVLCLSAGIVFQQHFPPLVGVYFLFLPRDFLGASRMVAVAFNVRYLSKTHVSEKASPRPRESGNPSSHSLYVFVYIFGHADVMVVHVPCSIVLRKLPVAGSTRHTRPTSHRCHRSSPEHFRLSDRRCRCSAWRHCPGPEDSGHHRRR